MKMEYLKQLPGAMVDPWMITSGKNGRYTFVLQLKDKNGATIVVPVAINKDASRYGIAEPLDIAESAYGKTEKDNKTPDYSWLIGEKGAIAEGRILYVNKQSTREFAGAVRVSYPLADQLSSALSNLIISAEAGKIKTEDDLAAFKAEHPSMYQQGRTVKGSTSFSETSPLKVVSLFQTADRSTFMHEMSHVYLLDLERLAAAAPDSRFAKDYATVMAWASWKKGMAEEYKGTASYEEFKKREQNILEAQIKGDTETEQKLLNEWAQERFARGFEEYLRKGETPAVGLQNAFRNFKRWLTKIY